MISTKFTGKIFQNIKKDKKKQSKLQMLSFWDVSGQRSQIIQMGEHHVQTRTLSKLTKQIPKPYYDCIW